MELRSPAPEPSSFIRYSSFRIQQYAPSQRSPSSQLAKFWDARHRYYAAMRHRTNRPSLHRTPHGAYETAQHYVGDLIYGTNDGILTSFAIVAGVSGGALSSSAVLIVGVANLFADGLSMGVGNFLSIRARESARERQNLPEEEANPARHGFATFLAFAVAGAIPLLPYIVPNLEFQFLLSSVLALVAQFAVGALRSLVTASRWWVSGLEMLGLGVLVAVVAYGTGAGIAAIVHGGA